jgi:hypothetical protein
MRHHHSSLLTSSLACIAAISLLGSRATAASGNTDDRYRFVVDSVTTKIEYAVDTNLGPCTIAGGTNGTLSGTVFMQLHAGVLPLESGSCDGGDCSCLPDLVATIPNTVPGLPPLLELDFLNLRISPSSPTFAVAHGVFDTDSSFAVLDGTMVVRLLGYSPTTLSLVGSTSDSESSHGEIVIDHAGIHIGRQFSNRLNVDVPGLGLVVHLGVAGVIRADMSYPPADRFCSATANSSGLPGRIDSSGTTSVTMNDCVLAVSGCPHDSFAFLFFGSDRGQVTFGNGVRCVTGTLHRLPTLHLSSSGTASLALDLNDAHVAGSLRPGSTWGFQCGFRDTAAGGARLNATDAIGLRFVP